MTCESPCGTEEVVVKTDETLLGEAVAEVFVAGVLFAVGMIVSFGDALA